ncbi:hypothetical protein [Reyranella sp.]|uniref:hypothetical protein n=1 Tax=Reyranella sp. TaxID=1929291 RepID=UPI003BA8CC7E
MREILGVATSFFFGFLVTSAVASSMETVQVAHPQPDLPCDLYGMFVSVSGSGHFVSLAPQAPAPAIGSTAPL